MDTSALLAHLFDEEGAERVHSIFTEHAGHIGISVLSIAEMRGRLRMELDNTEEISEICSRYFDFLTVTINVDRPAAELAEHIRMSVSKRIPLVDALIAACARSRNAVLVHSDPHFAAIPDTVVRQLKLA